MYAGADNTWAALGRFEGDVTECTLAPKADGSSECTWERIMPAGWLKRHVTHFHPAFPEIVQQHGVTHFLLVEGPHDETPRNATPYMFGADKIIGPWVLLWWDGKPRFMHCLACAGICTEWVIDMQPHWRVEFKGAWDGCASAAARQ